MKLRMVPEDVAKEVLPIIKTIVSSMGRTAEIHADVWDSQEANELKDAVVTLQNLCDYLQG